MHMRHHVHALLVILVAVMAAAATGAELVKPLSYHFAMTTLHGDDSAADPNFTKLTDGKKGGPGRVIWRKKENHGVPFTIAFDFEHDTSLSAVTVHYFRWKRSYGLKDIKVVGINAEGARLPLGVITLNQPYHLPEGEPHYMSAVIPSDDPRPVRQVEVTITGTGGYVGVSEIEFTGVVKAEALESAVEQKYDFLVAAAGPGLRLKQGDGYAVLENDHVIYVIDAGCGGTVNYAYDKHAQVNLVKTTAPGQGYGGLFVDRFWPGNYAIRDMYRDLPYALTIVDDEPDRKTVRVSSIGKSGIFLNVTLEKTYTLTAGSSTLTVDYKISNDQANVVPLNYGLWMFSGVLTPSPYQRIFPGRAAVESHPGVKQFTSRAFSSGWFGILCEDNGLALTIPYELFKAFYCWASSETAGSIECKLGVYPIPAGDDLRCSFAVCPFTGIGKPDHLNQIMAGSLGLEPEYQNQPEANTLRLRLFRPDDYAVTVKAARLNADGKPEAWHDLASATVDKKQTVAALTYRLPTLTEGTWLVTAEAKRFDAVVFTMQAATIFQKASAIFELPQACDIRPDVSEQGQKLNLNFNSMDYETRHVTWARPYAQGKPTVLAVCYDKNGCREMVELAQRFELDITTNFIGGLWRISGQTTTLSPSSCLAELQKQLKKRYDVIVVSGDVWNLLSKNLQDAILAQVEAGCGLVLCAPEGHPKALADQFSLAEKAKHILAEWQPEDGNDIVAGIPFAALPQTRILNYTTTGKVLATAAGHPLVAQFTYGKGAVFAAAWAVDGRNREQTTPETYKRRYSPVFLPSMSFLNPDLTYDYHEYHLSLLGKMIYAAAGRAPKIRVDNLTASAGTITAVITTAEPRELTANLTLRDKFSTAFHTETRSLSLQAGANAITLDVPKPVLPGLVLADLILTSPTGTEWWGADAFLHQTTAAITAFEIEDKIWRQSEIVTGAVTATGDASLTVSLYDAWGNEIARSHDSNFALPLRDCQSLVFYAEAVLRRQDTIVDRVRLRRARYGTTDPELLQIVFGWPGISNSNMPAFLVDDYIKIMRRFGINGSSGSGSEWEIPFMVKALRNQNLAFVSTNSTAGTGGKFPYDANRTITSKFDLIRTPCLSQPGLKDSIRQRSAGFADYPATRYGVHMVAGPDEANMISNNDLCFSPDCQREFRNWLRRQYSSLDALNHSWKTSFASWDDVIAMTSDEVKKHPSYAPWLDHRSFNDWNRADAIGYVVRGIHDVDPNLAYSLSGTQETNPWNAWDWYQLMPHLQALSSYTGEQTIQQRCFANGKLMQEPWIGYDGDYRHHNQYLLDKLFKGATGFRIYSGRFYINPDFTLPPLALDLIRALDRYRNGPAELIMRAELLTYPIAFLYSPASIKLDWIIGANALRRSAVTGFANLIYDAALTYDYIAYGHLETTDRLRERYRILILPAAAAMSPAEVATVRQFAADGGIVIADLLTATYDQHGCPYDKSPACDLFGLQNTGVLNMQPATITGLNAEAEGLTLKNLSMTVPAWESGLIAKTAKPLAEITADGQKHHVAFVNPIGKGCAVYFGAAIMTTIGDWQEMRYTSANAPQLKIISQLLDVLFQRAGITPIATADLKATSIQVRQNGPLRILGLVRDYKQAANLDPGVTPRAVNLDRKYHVYDLLEGGYLGFHKTFTHPFAADSQNAFALLPSQPQKLVAAVTPGANRAYTIHLALDTAGPQSAEHAIRLRLTDPSGAENPICPGLRFARHGQDGFTLTMPLNATPGQWTLSAEDVITRLQTTCRFNVPK